MSSAESQKPTCPVCQQSDQVKTTQAAYDSGVARTAPPDMPTRNVSMLPTMLACVIVVGICIFAIVVLIGSEANIGDVFSIILIGVTLVSIVVTLVLSYRAFQRVVQGDAEATREFPTWDRAMAAWKSLYYCARDDVVFDPKTGKTLSNEELAALRSMSDKKKASQVSATLVEK